MTTSGDLLAVYRAIIDDPDNDALREQYAVLAEQHGDPERARFIRLQLEAARRQRRDEPDWEPALAARDILETGDHAKRWAGPVGDIVGHASCWFFRGFVEKIRIDAGAFPSRAEELFALAPIRRLSLTGVAPVAEQLFRSEHLGRIVSLTLDNQDVGDRGVELLASSPHLGKLGYLYLGGNKITRRGLVALMSSDHLPALRRVDLYGNPVYDSDVGPEYGDDQGQPVWFHDELAIEKQFGRKTWLHTGQDHGRSYLQEGPY